MQSKKYLFLDIIANFSYLLKKAQGWGNLGTSSFVGVASYSLCLTRVYDIVASYSVCLTRVYDIILFFRVFDFFEWCI